jgi:protein arginine kinase activator
MKEEQTCDVCGKKAAVHVTLVKEGKSLTVSFCFDHAKAAGVFQPKGYGLIQEEKPGTVVAAGTVCNDCGLTLSEFNKKGRLGCWRCYNAFGDYIGKILSHIRQGSAHCGKVPAASTVSVGVDTEKAMRELNDRLAAAINNEAYEEAALVRDRISELQSHNDK